MKNLRVVSIALLGVVVTAMGHGQTNVTTSGGSSGTVPVYTGSATLGNSPITVSGSNVGIGTTSPSPTSALDVEGGELTVGGFVYQGTRSNALSFGGTGPNEAKIYVDLNGLMHLSGAQNQAVQADTGIIARGGKFTGNNSVWNGSPTVYVDPNYTGTLSSGYTQYVTEIVPTTTGGLTNQGSYVGLLVDTSAIPGTVHAALFNGGNVGIGTTSPSQTLEVNGSAQIDNGLYFPGSTTPQTTPWTGVLCGGDYSEAVEVKGNRTRYEPGDVLVLASDGNGEVEMSAEPYSTTVAGIYATRPGVVGRRASLSNAAAEVPMAMVGIVPTKVSAENGPIRRGDLLVSSSTPGYAMRGTDRSRLVGAVIGKAMGSLDSGKGVIQALVTLQ